VSNLSELLPAGGGQNNFTFTASGAISNGGPVVLNDDGTVSAVSETTYTGSAASSSQFESGYSFQMSQCCYHTSQDKVVVVYADNGNSNYGTIVAGQIASDGTISWGTPAVFSSASSFYNCVEYDATADKLVVAYSNTSTAQGRALVVTLTGTSFSFGSSQAFYTNNVSTRAMGLIYAPSAGAVLLHYEQQGGADQMMAVICTVSGTSISFTGQIQVNNDTVNFYAASCYDSDNNQVVLVYEKTNLTLNAAMLSVTSSSISVVSNATLTPGGNPGYLSVAYDQAARKAVLGYLDSTTSDTNVAVIDTVTPAFGSIAQVTTDNYEWVNVVYDTAARKCVILGRNDTQSGRLAARTINVSGTSANFTAELTVSTNNIRDVVATYSTGQNRLFVAYRNGSDSDTGYGVTFTPEYTQSNIYVKPFIGLAGQAISDTASGTINVVGSLNEGQSGLTIGSDYYVQDDGTLSTTVSDTKVGKAISATQINMKNRS
jgi:hypothetical protein